jgi:hypothetical protein
VTKSNALSLNGKRRESHRTKGFPSLTRLFIRLSLTGLMFRSQSKLALGNGLAPDATSRQDRDLFLQSNRTL